MSFYQTLIREIDPCLNPAGVEASMRLQYGTLNHLPRETFELEIRLGKACEAEQPASSGASPGPSECSTTSTARTG